MAKKQQKVKKPDTQFDPNNHYHKEKLNMLINMKNQMGRHVTLYGGYSLDTIEDLICVGAHNVESVYISSGVLRSEYTAKDCVDHAITLVAAWIGRGEAPLNFSIPTAGYIESKFIEDRPTDAENNARIEKFYETYPFLRHEY